MNDRDFEQPSQHEREVLAERRERDDEVDDLTGEAPGEVGTTPYEAEVDAERRGSSAEHVAREAGRDEAEPLDSAYQPKTG